MHPTPRIALFVRPLVGSFVTKFDHIFNGRKSSSRRTCIIPTSSYIIPTYIMYTCIMDTFIMDTCITLWIHASCIHASCIHASCIHASCIHAPWIHVSSDMRFVKSFTRPDFWAKNFTLEFATNCTHN